ncbi:clathrin heavy chain-like protein [Leptotrombidium deliense]|uniref:Clathrin heavy chain-like protein n=1 Tax=Leptotrombidium deliense TaxID=299467 RepID=A0A443S3Z9_9ACAR|nr:clathrin heavy chain-like protein [Leptotrombidium deliense]
MKAFLISLLLLLTLMFTEVSFLTNLGICIADVSWSKVRMTSGDWICIRRAIERNYSDVTISKRNLGASVLTLLNPYDNHIESFECCLVSSAQVNPMKKLIALTSFANTLHVICLDSNVCIASTHLPSETRFWTWLDERHIGIITSFAVHHWNFEDENNCLKVMFNRSERLANCQITNYEIDESKSWCALSCLYLDKVFQYTAISSFYRNKYCLWNRANILPSIQPIPMH